MQVNSHQVEIGNTLDVAAIERELALLWKQSAQEHVDEETAVMRARVANLVVFTPGQELLKDINATLNDLSAVHPSRALVIVAERDAGDRDIELYVSSYAQEDNRGARLCCEEVMMNARGKFVPELPSAALPLLISDVPTFLWWRDRLQPDDRTFLAFSEAANRLVIDTAEVGGTEATLSALARLFNEGTHEELGISDINWARLTSWRALLASFYDLPHCKAAFENIAKVVIDYSPPKDDDSGVAPQPLLLAGWLMSRLNWDLSDEPPVAADKTLQFVLVRDGRRVALELNRVARPGVRPGRLARVQLTTEADTASFVVLRHENGLHLETTASIAGINQPGRVLPVRNRSTAQLLGRELEILCNDNIYMESVKVATKLVKSYS